MKYVVALLLFGGCAMDRDVQPSIDQGVYGLLSSAGLPAANQMVTIYAVGAQGMSATSDDNGFYQIDLPNGDYMLCTVGCITISTPSLATVRYDWTDGPGGGTWDKI